MTINKRQRGFTLIEVMIVVAIIGVLAALALPMYQEYTVRAKISEGIGMATPAMQAVGVYYSDNSSMPADNAAAGIAAPGDYATDFVSSVTVTNGIVEVDLNIASLGSDDKIVFVPDTSGMPLVWDCTTSTTVEKRFLPSRCR